MDMNNGVRIDCGKGGAGERRTKGKNWDNCDSINNKKVKIINTNFHPQMQKERKQETYVTLVLTAQDSNT